MVSENVSQSTTYLSAEEMMKLRLEREIRLTIIEENRKRITDISSVLDATPPRNLPSVSGLQRIVESRTWKTSSYGEWAFLNEKDGKPVEALRPVVEAIKRSTAEKLVLGAFEYSVSGGKFLNRRRC